MSTYTESDFQFTPTRKRRKSRKARKNYVTVTLTPRSAKGRYPKGQGFNRGLTVPSRVVRGDRIFDHGPITDPHNDPYLRS